VPRFNRLSLSLAGTAAVALVSLPLGITNASAAKVTEGTASSAAVSAWCERSLLTRCGVVADGARGMS